MDDTDRKEYLRTMMELLNTFHTPMTSATQIAIDKITKVCNDIHIKISKSPTTREWGVARFHELTPLPQNNGLLITRWSQ